jgi:integrase
MAGTRRDNVGVARPRPITDHRPLRREVPAYLTCAELAAAWLADERQARSVDSYRSFVRVHVLPLFGSTPPAAVDERELNAWARARRLDGYTPATITNLSAFWVSLLRFGGVELDTAQLGLSRVRQTSTRAADVLTASEVARLVRTRRGHLYDRALVAGLLLTGMRIGELIGATWAQLDTGAPTLWRLEYSQAWRTKARAMGPTKDDSTHTLAVHPELQQLLEQVRDVYYDGRPPADAPVWPFFPTRNGGFLGLHGHSPRLMLADRRRWNARTALKHWYRALARHELRARTEHVARHTFGSLLADAGANPLAIHALTHPGSVPSSSGAGGRTSSWGRYIHTSWEARVEAVLTLRLPVVALDDEPQLALDL